MDSAPHRPPPPPFLLPGYRLGGRIKMDELVRIIFPMPPPTLYKKYIYIGK